jgi:hypothetical protein
MPRSRSIAIQSERARRRSPRALTSPANWIAPPNSSNFSVKVVLPASGCEMIAKVRRRKISSVRVLINPLWLLPGRGRRWQALMLPGAGGDMMRARLFANSYRKGSPRHAAQNGVFGSSQAQGRLLDAIGNNISLIVWILHRDRGTRRVINQRQASPKAWETRWNQ